MENQWWLASLIVFAFQLIGAAPVVGVLWCIKERRTEVPGESDLVLVISVVFPAVAALVVWVLVGTHVTSGLLFLVLVLSSALASTISTFLGLRARFFGPPFEQREYVVPAIIVSVLSILVGIICTACLSLILI